jgi:hypothetical protein
MQPNKAELWKEEEEIDGLTISAAATLKEEQKSKHCDNPAHFMYIHYNFVFGLVC